MNAEEELGFLRRLESVIIQDMEGLVGELSETSYDEKDWVVIYDENERGNRRIPGPDAITEARDKSRQLYWKGNEYIRRAVANSKNYIVGKGMTFSLSDPKGQYPEETRIAVNDYWRKWEKLNHWRAKQRETVERGCLDGEWFYHLKPKGRFLSIRFLEPEDIKDPSANTKWPYGIRYNPDDVEEVYAYAWNPGNAFVSGVDGPSRGWLEPREIQHGFWFGTRSMIRGFPPLKPILERVRQYDSWLRDRLVLNKLRARIALIRRFRGATPTEVRNFADTQKDGETIKSSKTGDETERRRMYKAGTIIDTNGQVEYEFLAPNLDASDVQHDGRAVLLSITAGTGQSEVMVTADASNSNFASTWIAEAPAVKEFEVGQGICEEEFEQVWHRVMLYGQEVGEIPVNPDADPEILDSGYDVEIQPPRLVGRDRLEDAKSSSLMHTAGAMSRKTWMLRDGLDPEDEEEQIRKEDEEETGFGHEETILTSTTTTPEEEEEE